MLILKVVLDIIFHFVILVPSRSISQELSKVVTLDVVIDSFNICIFKILVWCSVQAISIFVNLKNPYKIDSRIIFLRNYINQIQIHARIFVNQWFVYSCVNHIWIVDLQTYNPLQPFIMFEGGYLGSTKWIVTTLNKVSNAISNILINLTWIL